MGFFGKLFGKEKPEPVVAPEHGVVIHFQYGSTDLGRLKALEDRLERAIAAAGVGELDGNEIATDGSDGFLYLYGPDADPLFKAIRPALESEPFMKGARVKLRHGRPNENARQTEIQLPG